MSNLRNKVNLIGRVGNTPEKKEVGNGYTLTRFSIATNESLKDNATGEWKKLTTWHNVYAWGKTAEPSTPVKTGPSLSDKIKEKLRLDALEEEERARVPESDVWKMTRGQLQAGGWDILSLGETKVQEESKLLRTYSFTQEGLSFYDYTYYLRKPIKTRVVEVGPAVIQEDIEDLEDLDEWD